MLHKILFVLQQNLLTTNLLRDISSANDFFHLPKFSQVSLNFNDAVEKFRGPTICLSGGKILCSLTKYPSLYTYTVPIIVP